MIHHQTRKILQLTPITRDDCHSFYIQINSEPHGVEDIKESISFWQTDAEQLNKLWWVLNYYSEHLDSSRDLRAHVENTLDALARERAYRKSDPQGV